MSEVSGTTSLAAAAPQSARTQPSHHTPTNCIMTSAVYCSHQQHPPAACGKKYLRSIPSSLIVLTRPLYTDTRAVLLSAELSGYACPRLANLRCTTYLSYTLCAHVNPFILGPFVTCMCRLLILTMSILHPIFPCDPRDWHLQRL